MSDVFYTIDLELADRILPSYCCISIIQWSDGIIKNVYSSLLYPDCDIEEYMQKRHGIKAKDLKDAPTFANVWNELFPIIKGKMIFFANGAKEVAMLQQRLAADYLSMPNFKYGSVMSICRRTWDNISKYNMETVTSELNISSTHFNSLNDAVSMGIIIGKSMEYHKVDTVVALFDKIGYSGGYIIGNTKVPYRAIKDKRSGEFYEKIER